MGWRCGGTRRGAGAAATVAGLALAMVVALGLAGCGDAEGRATGADGEGPGDGPPRIVASIFPLASLTQQIVGDVAEVQTLLPPGVTPHGFEMTADRLRTLSDADVLVVVGLGLDPWASDAADQVGGDLRVIRMADLTGEGHTDPPAGHDEHEHHDHGHHDHAHAEHADDPHAHDAHGHDAHAHDDHGHDHIGPNPHLWLDPVHTAHFVEHLGEALAERYPAHAETFRANTEALLASINEVDAAYREGLSDVRHRQLVTFHNAFDLLAERYGLEVAAHLTPIELNPGAEVAPARLVRALEVVRRYGLPVIYAEPQFPDAAVKALRREADVTVLRLDPLGHPGRAGYDTWQAMMRSNLATLADGQNRTVPQ